MKEKRLSTASVIVFAALLMISPDLAAAEKDSEEKKFGFVPAYRPEITIRRAAGPIEIDGKLGDKGWAEAAMASNFVEHNPGDQTKPDVETEVLITYDDQHLYVAWICYDDPEEVRASFCERDNIFSDDNVVLCLDTYGEASLAYEIMANPYGIPGDLLYSSSNGEDSSYDMIFETAGSITEFGWVVEMAVPFRSLRFPDIEDQVWRVDFWRNRPRGSRFQYSWAAYDRDEDCWPCQWGTMKGISGVESGAGFELLPAVVAHQSGSMNEYGHMDNGDVMGDVALGLSYDISSELTAEATVNPDFSQVEADEGQIDVNTTFALSYPEKRPFFQEGSDLFDTYFETVYTRSINDPVVAGKLTWRKGPNSLAILSARDEHSPIVIPFEERSAIFENGKSYSNILRYRRDFGEQRHLGIVATDRRFEGGGSGSLVGIDGQIRFSESNLARFQYIQTYTEEIDNLALADSAFNERRFDGGSYTAGLDGETFWGHGFLGQISRSPSDYYISGTYRELSPTFRADNGLEPSNNWRMGSIDIGGILRFEESDVLETIDGDLDVTRKWNFDGVKKDEWLNASLVTRFRTAQTTIHVSYMRSNELFHGIQFNGIYQGHICFSAKPSGALSFGGNYNYGHRIARGFDLMGMETQYGGWADIKPVDRLLISTSFTHVYSDNLYSGERLFSQSIFWSRFSLQLSRELSLRFVAQYNDRIEQWDLDPLLKYRLNSFTVFYVGSTHDYRDTEFSDFGREGWAQTERQYFLKMQYLFQI